MKDAQWARKKQVDQTVFHLINEQWTHPALDLFMAAISAVEIWKPFLILIVIVALIFGGFRARACLLCLLATLVLAEQGTTWLKTAFDRRRPKQVQEVRMVQLEKASPAFLTLFKKPEIRRSDRKDRNLARSGPSFPSGHMTNNTIIALCLTLFYPRWGWLYWIITLAIGYSRIYLGAHWPSDVVATLFLAVAETLLMVALFEIGWRLVGRKWFRGTYQKHPSLRTRPA